MSFDTSMFQPYIDESTPGWPKLNMPIGITSHFVWCHQTGVRVVHPDEVRIKNTIGSFRVIPLYWASILFIDSQFFRCFCLPIAWFPIAATSAPAPADLFIHLMVRLNSQPPVSLQEGNKLAHDSSLSLIEQSYLVLQAWQNFTKESISTVVQWNEILKCLHFMSLQLSDALDVDNSLFKLLLDRLSHISREQFWFGSTVMRSIHGNGVD
jgi:hypothetical protein